MPSRGTAPRLPSMQCVLRLSAQQLQDFLQLEPELPHDLLALAHISACLLAGELVARTADREALLVEQAADLTNDDHVLALVLAAFSAPLDGLQLGKLLPPVPPHVRLDAAQVAHLADREIALARYRR